MEFSIKAYDIVSMMRHPDDMSCQSITNEKFQVHPDTESIRVHFNPRLRNKRIACMVKNQTSGKREETNTIRSGVPTNHKDNENEIDLPPGYKIIGVRGFKTTSDQTVLHICDFLIWKPQPGWLDISLEGLAKRDGEQLTLLNFKKHGLTSGQSWFSTQNLKPKNFMRLNHDKLKN